MQAGNNIDKIVKIIKRGKFKKGYTELKLKDLMELNKEMIKYVMPTRNINGRKYYVFE